MRILVVDDQVDFLPLVSSWLRMLRGIVAVEVSASPTEALALLDDLKPDLVITDLNMPEMNGLELTRRVKARPTPPLVVVMTALPLQRYEDQAREAGADYFLEKSRLHKALPQFLTERFGVGAAPV